MREISQREYDRQDREMNDIYHLSPVMKETLLWFVRDAGFGCPGTEATFKALGRRGLLFRVHSGQWQINETGRRAAAA